MNETRLASPALAGTFPVSYHFQVAFFSGPPSPTCFEIRFQRVSGLSAEISTQQIVEGGASDETQTLPIRGRYGNVQLDRGVLPAHSFLNTQFETMMNTFRFTPAHVLVTLLNEQSLPACAWILQRAYPVKWQLSELDAFQNSLVIETLELAYTGFRQVRV